MKYDVNKEFDILFEELEKFGLKEQAAIDGIAYILSIVNSELQKLRGTYHNKFDEDLH